ncbi:LemA protein [Fluviicoccus keumensis]|uniref:LemA protein n=1 Tax=Fluviicoccus keumensis TaxID=1435465 RepID=A0A4Q7YI97_9GAMM|nr:LemA family protein [Fluviicoccus keumensis]RZU36848.1 LemA protein [Fluviicoccus keumensis]
MTSTVVYLAILAVAAFYGVNVYNALVSLRNQYSNAFAQIDVQLQRRYELIPNLVEAAKAYLSHEKDTLSAVIAARNQAAGLEKALAGNAGNADAMAKFAQAEGVLNGALGRLLAVSESYPDLKADATIADLMEELKSTENRVGFARQAFNDAVMAYNIRREQFPDNVVAGLCAFHRASLLEIPNVEAREPVRIRMT